MGAGASKNKPNHRNNPRNRHDPISIHESGTNRHSLDREERPRNTHDDLFSTDPFQLVDNDIRPIEELSPRESYLPTDQPRNEESFAEPGDHRGQQPAVHDRGPARSLQRASGGQVDRWGREPWLGRDGWPQRHPHDGYYGGYAPYPSYRRHGGYQVVQPPRYEDIVLDRLPAQRPHRHQPIERQRDQHPVLVANQNGRAEPRYRHQDDNVGARSSRVDEDNVQNLEVESMLSYGRGGEDDVTKRVQQLNNDKNIKMSDGKIPPDDDVINGKEEEKEVPVFKEDDDEYIGANLRFYRNEITYRPHGEYIDNIHKYWYGDYQRLEKTLTYIQWLFPLAERSSVNPFALPLQKHEAKYIKDDEETYNRVITSYQMMLDFFGMILANPKTGEVARSDIWKERFTQLKRSGKNYFRITRIIRSLGALGFYLYQAPFVMFLLHEVLETKELAAVPPGIVNTWLGAVDNAFDREYIRKQFQQSLNEMNDLYGKKSVRIHVNNDKHYESARHRDKNGDHPHRHSNRHRYTYAQDSYRIEE